MIRTDVSRRVGAADVGVFFRYGHAPDEFRQALLERGLNLWPSGAKAVLPLAKAIYYSCFDEVEEAALDMYRAPGEADIQGIFAFIDSLSSSPPYPPLMILVSKVFPAVLP